MKIIDNPLEDIRMRLSAIESKLSGEPISEQGFGKYDDDPIEDIMGYLISIDDLVKNQSKSEVSSNEALHMLADAYKRLAEKQIDKTTFKSIINDAFCEKKSEIKREIKHDGFLNEQDKQEIETLSYVVSELRKGATITSKISDKDKSTIDNFNANFKILLSEGLGDKIEEKIKRTVNQNMSSLDVRLKDTIKNESEEFYSLHKISYFVAFFAGILIAASIFIWWNASAKEEQAEEQMIKAQEEIRTSWKYYILYQWMKDQHPDIVDEYRNQYTHQTKPIQQ